MIKGKNWAERSRQSYKMQIMTDTRYKTDSEIKRLAQYWEKKSGSTLVLRLITKQQ